jgi:hypothetical protein
MENSPRPAIDGMLAAQVGLTFESSREPREVRRFVLREVPRPIDLAAIVN